MSEVLVKRLQTLLTAEILIITMADRIEELEAQLKTMIDQQVVENMVRVAEPMLSDVLAAADKRIKEFEANLTSMSIDCLAADGQAQEAYQAQLDAEAKLAKAVEALSAYRGMKRKLLAALKMLEEK